MLLLTAPLPQDRRFASADACDLPETVDFDGETFTFDSYTVREDNRGNAEWTYFYVSDSGRWAVTGGFSWSVTA